MVEILLAHSDEEILSCYDVVVQLRPVFTQTSFLQQVKKQMSEKYNLAYLKVGEEVCAVAGYRYSECLAWGKFLYVDDLVTSDNQRSNGYGKLLLDWLLQQAKNNECQQLHLDSGIQRIEAHRFYNREGLEFTSKHYAVEII